jgi:O-antigen ligase
LSASHEHGHSRHETGLHGPVLFWAAALVIVFAPLFRAANRPLPLAILELAGIAMLAYIAWNVPRQAFGHLPATLRWGAALLAVSPLVQLVPVPMAWWAMLPGHAPFAQVLETGGAAAGWRSITLHSAATQYAWLVLLPCAAIFLAVRSIDRSKLKTLAIIFVAVASVEAVVGILQTGTTAGSPINFGNPWAGVGASGTYVNKNHFAGLISMALPMLLALWAIEMLPVTTRRGEILREHPRSADRKFALRALFSMLTVVLLVALVLSRSRAGIAAGLLVFALAIVALIWRAASLQVKVALAGVALVALGLAAGVGLTPVLERFAPDAFSMEYRSRMELAGATFKAALDFMPLGSGLGTFADVFRRYQGGRVTGFADHAHNDYAELVLELGVAGVAVIVLLAAAYVTRWPAVVRRRESRRLRFMQVAAGLGMLAMIVHGWFDFNFHIPANAIFFSFLAGLFFFTPAEDRA